MKLKIIGIVVLSLVMASSLALADTLTFVNTEGAWQTLTAAQINQNNTGNPFWANTSNDGANRNVGYILTGQNLGVPSPTVNFLGLGVSGATPEYLAGDGTNGVAGAPVNNVWVNRTDPGTTSTYLVITIAGHSGFNSFGVYDLAAATNGNFAVNGDGTGAWQQIIAPSQSPGNFGATISYSNYGFYFYDASTGMLFVSDPIANSDPAKRLTSADANSNFAFFQNAATAGVFFIGMEDLVYPVGGEGNYGDFNDMVVQVSFPGAVPVPPSALLLGSGLLGLVGLGWRRRKNA